MSKRKPIKVLWEKRFWKRVISKVPSSKRQILDKYFVFDEWVLKIKFKKNDDIDIKIKPNISIKTNIEELMLIEVNKYGRSAKSVEKEIYETNDFLEDFLNNADIFYEALVVEGVWPKDVLIDNEDIYEKYIHAGEEENNEIFDSEEYLQCEGQELIRKYFFTKDDWEKVIQSLSDPENDLTPVIKNEDDRESYIDWIRTFYPMDEVEIVIDLEKYNPYKERSWHYPLTKSFNQLHEEFNRKPHDPNDYVQKKYYKGSYCYITALMLEEIESYLIKKGFFPDKNNFVPPSIDENEGEDVYEDGFVYFIRNKDIYKIGITQNMLQRMAQLKPDEVLDSIRCSNYREIEKEIHKEFKAKRIPQTEYFRLDKEEINEIHQILKDKAL